MAIQLAGGNEIIIDIPDHGRKFPVIACGREFYSGPVTLADVVDLP
jgi:hypothetical protein